MTDCEETDLPWEDSLLERKVESDLKDLLKTVVAFANSVAPGHTAVILIGEKDDGTVQGVTSADNIQKKVRETCDKVYPPIVWKSSVYQKNGGTCVRVEIDYDGETPHFGESAWLRRGSSSVKASDELFQKLIELRLSKVRELAKWIDREVTVEGDTGELRDQRMGAMYLNHPRLGKGSLTALITQVNNFWASFDIKVGKNIRQSEPLEKILLSWDDTNNRLKLLIQP